ncbi:F-box domain-containing protein [Aphelenchoides avenae]|nr:F-box domain-containing protein [Aphelenchus avenae]
MELLPEEVLRRILTSDLDKGNQLNASLTCRKWLDLLEEKLPRPLELHITLDSVACNARIWFVLASWSTVNVEKLEVIAPIMTPNSNCVSVVSIGPAKMLFCASSFNFAATANQDRLFDSSLYVSLRECGTRLTKLHFHSVDMSAVRVWTLAAIAKFTMLTSITFENCVFPKGFNESLLIRLLSPSFACLETIAITENSMVTDKFGVAVAKKCRRLQNLVLNDCHGMTALTVVGFCESLMNHESLAVNIQLRSCGFNPMELERHLHNPLLQCGPCWKARPMTVNIGFDRSAILLENAVERDRVILVYF